MMERCSADANAKKQESEKDICVLRLQKENEIAALKFEEQIDILRQESENKLLKQENMFLERQKIDTEFLSIMQSYYE